jgi:hypothetical protein
MSMTMTAAQYYETSPWSYREKLMAIVEKISLTLLTFGESPTADEYEAMAEREMDHYRRSQMARRAATGAGPAMP